MVANPLTQFKEFKDLVDAEPFFTQDKLIVVEGPIGVGKTSLVRRLCDKWKAAPLFEIFEENPFLTTGFYEDTPRFAFSTEMFFLLSRFRQQQEIKNSKGLLISDYLFEKNSIFAKMNLQLGDWNIFQNVYQQLLPEVRKPDLVILLKADLETLMRRVYFRDRKFERSLSAAYLEGLVNDYYRFFSTYQDAPVLSIQTSGMDFVNDPQDFNKILALIEERVHGHVQLTLKTKSREPHV